jgi:hypothetical protein
MEIPLSRRSGSVRAISVPLALLLATAGFADTLILRDGRTVNGTYIGATPREIKIDVGGEIRNFSVSDVSILSFGSSTEPQGQDAYPAKFGFLIGEWECLTPGNHYRMRVGWDSPSGQFRGYLTKQGLAMEDVGFKIGEHMWIAEPINERTLVERIKFRRGANGVSSDYQWLTGNVNLEQSARDRLLGTNSLLPEFMRVR